MSTKIQRNKRILFLVLFTFLLLVVDQVTKKLVTFWIPLGSSTPLVDEFIYLTPVKNQGLIMGFPLSTLYLTTFFVIFGMMIFIFFWLPKLRRKGSVGIAFIISGAVGNLLDRVLRGGVIDFIDVKFWSIFNIADIFITVGVVLLCLNLIFSRKKCTE